MKILFFGRTQGNSGPDNVNRAFYDHLTDAFLPASAEGSFAAVAADLAKLLRCDALVVSGLSRKGCFLAGAAKLLGKELLYIAHGCAEWERERNDLKAAAPVKQERFLMKNSSRILAVSRMYRDWLAGRYPHWAEKLDWLNPGGPEILPGSVLPEKQPGSVLAAGADRPVKNNMSLARAVEELGGNFHLEVCGALCYEDPFAEFRHTRYLGLLSQQAYWQKLRETEIFVVNATLEPFSLSALEALACGCSLLISKPCGVCDLLPLEEGDIICDPLDTEELKNKLEWIHTHPNNHRLQAKNWTWEDAVARLESLCQKGGAA